MFVLNIFNIDRRAVACSKIELATASFIIYLGKNLTLRGEIFSIIMIQKK